MNVCVCVYVCVWKRKGRYKIVERENREWGKWRNDKKLMMRMYSEKMKALQHEMSEEM